MISALLVALALSAPVEARTKTPPRPAPKPQPPPPEPDEEDESPVFDPPEPDEPDEPTPPPKKRGNPFDPSKPDFTEEEYGAIGLGALCTCFCFVAGIVALIVFIVRRGNKPGQPQAATAPPPPGAAPMTAPFHLSVFAVGMRANARQTVAQQLILAGAQADPTTATERAHLVRELSKAVRGLETEWTHFGYGERLDLADESAAQRSYQLAVDDFSKRSADTSLSGESTYTVMTLVLCTRRQLRGVSALDDRAQIRALLDDRGALSEHDLMGAFIAWSQPLGGYEVLTRFPEMHAVK